MEGIAALIEALLLVAEAPLPVERIGEVVPDAAKTNILRALRELAADYERRQGGFFLEEVAGGFQFRTRPQFAPWIRQLRKGRPHALSRAAMETLAVVAYRQPVVKADIDAIRGVDAGGTLKSLLEKKLVRIVGRKDIPGKPMIYGTTRKFLEVFALKDLSELPTLRELEEMQQ